MKLYVYAVEPDGAPVSMSLNKDYTGKAEVVYVEDGKQKKAKIPAIILLRLAEKMFLQDIADELTNYVMNMQATVLETINHAEPGKNSQNASEAQEALGEKSGHAAVSTPSLFKP